MTQEDKELLLRDLCTRLPYGLWIDDGYALAIHIDYSDVHFENYFNGILNGYVKPYLRSMSSMTEEEKREYNSFSLGEDRVSNPYMSVPAFHILDWLNSHHFDYRGLIDKGIALEAQKGMYR